jgi:hypothetical protein
MSAGPKALLIIGPSMRMRLDVGSKITQTWPQTRVDYHDSLVGVPGPDMLSGPYDGMLIAHDLAIQSESGLAWLREMRDAGPMPPTILLTDSTQGIVQETALQNGACACLIIEQITADKLREVCARVWNAAADVPYDRTEVVELSEARSSSASQSQPQSLIFQSIDGKVIDVPGYRVEGLIAHGGMSAVYRAVREGDQKRVALKVLHLGEEHDRELIHRFMQEYASVAKLRHPNVISIEERGFSSDFAYISMEYCPSGDLKGRIQLGLLPRDILDYARQMALGLGAAHRTGLVHRDVKPGNMLFREDGTLVVSDFGVAKDISESHRNLTKPKAVVGTVYYVSPEQILAEPVDARCDLYGLGAVIYQMLTGYPPFVRKERADILDAHINEPVPPLTGKNLQFQKLVDGLLAKDPNDRFQSTEEVVEGLNWIEESLV